MAHFLALEASHLLLPAVGGIMSRAITGLTDFRRWGVVASSLVVSPTNLAKCGAASIQILVPKVGTSTSLSLSRRLVLPLVLFLITD